MVEAEAGRQELARRTRVVAVPEPQRARAAPGTGWAGSLDLLGWMALALVAAGAAFALPSGNALRAVLAALVVFVVPGVLLMEALFPPWHAAPPARRFRIAVALGVSPALVGLVALSTALVPGGFRPANIIAVVTLACLLLGAAGIARRARPGEEPAPGARVLALSPAALLRRRG